MLRRSQIYVETSEMCNIFSTLGIKIYKKYSSSLYISFIYILKKYSFILLLQVFQVIQVLQVLLKIKR